MRNWRQERGFALPTIVVAGMVLMILLVSAVATLTSVRVALTDQYYNQLAREAAESGSAQAIACLKQNNYVAQWTAANQLHPDTSCTGGAACTNADSCYVSKSTNYASTYSVAAPVVSGSGSQTMQITGTVSLLRTGSGTTWKTYTQTINFMLGGVVSVQSIAFGYNPGGAYFGAIGMDGNVRTLGINNYGQLGNGTMTSSLVPTKMILPGIQTVKLFTDFLSGGVRMVALTSTGDIYSAGDNTQGATGNGSIGGYLSTPVKFILPSGKQARSASMASPNTFVITTDNNVYAAGSCANGWLGSSYTISGCSNQANPVRVALPTPNAADLNTLPTDNLIMDGQGVVIRMQGGRIYGWGTNKYGMLNYADTNPTTYTSTPRQLGTFGDSGQPKAVDVSFDGVTIYITDSNGQLWALGLKLYGEAGLYNAPIMYNSNTSLCMDGAVWRAYSCNGMLSQQYTFNADGTIGWATGDGNNGCMQNVNGDNVTLGAAYCDSSLPRQKFQVLTDGNGIMKIYYPAGNKCVDAGGSSNGANTLYLYPCNNLIYQEFTIQTPISTTTGAPMKIPIPLSSGEKVIKTSTDYQFVAVLTNQGNVWTLGQNECGQLGNGAALGNSFNPAPQKYILPSGVTATDIYVTSGGGATNTLVVGSDGKVYGAGSNNYGQLGRGTFTACESTPQAMLTIDGSSIKAKQAVSGSGTSAIYATNGQVYTVGRNDNGQLGDGTTTNSAVPSTRQYLNIFTPVSY